MLPRPWAVFPRRFHRLTRIRDTIRVIADRSGTNGLMVKPHYPARAQRPAHARHLAFMMTHGRSLTGDNFGLGSSG